MAYTCDRCTAPLVATDCDYQKIEDDLSETGYYDAHVTVFMCIPCRGQYEVETYPRICTHASAYHQL